MPTTQAAIAQQLLETSTGYIRSRREFATAIGNARRAGLDDDQIGRITTLSRPVLEAVAGSKRARR